MEETSEFLRGFIGGATEAPMHLVDNEFIRRGYRIGYNKSVGAIFRSLFEMHNETINVWSHMLGMVFFASMIFYTLYTVSGLQDVGSFVSVGFQQAKEQNQHFMHYFHTQLHKIEEDLYDFYFDHN